MIQGQADSIYTRMHTQHLTTEDVELLNSLPESELRVLLSDISQEDERLAASVLGQVDRHRWATNDKKEVASFFDVSIDTIDLWQRKGMPHQSGGKGVRGWYDLRECARWLADQRSGVSDDDKGKKQADSTYRSEKARIAELQRLQMEGELVPAGEFREGVMRVVVLIKKGIENFRRSFGNDGVEMLTDVVDEVESTLFGDESSSHD